MKNKINSINFIRDNTPDISVIIPFYNVEDYIEECLNSVIAQKGVRTEIILVDDGSTDGSVEIVKDFNKPVYPVLLETLHQHVKHRLVRLYVIVFASIRFQHRIQQVCAYVCQVLQSCE